ncbi:TRAP transporter small permease subunit [Salinisphaera sp. P385]|uniref:TRAP transporter small permease protein n=1 Tax=Spectribacter acetivorans TaxID=3075603 RepID=A0ABU3B8U2_9GAMM|nr:TRAP transporter small permease subunit [Salinisphaera sp. P385]MDT0618893.1 TRAP transporter small permease subunit [Salinisphaera sp. P385]
MRRLTRLVAGIDAVNNAIGRGVAWLTLVMVLADALVVGLRYGFGIGWTGLQESVTYMHAAVFLLAAAYALNRDDHVRVDIFQRQWSPRRRALVDLLGSLCLLLPVAVVLAALSVDYVTDAWQRLETSAQPGGLPFVYLLKTLILVVAAQLASAALARAGHCWLILRGASTEVGPWH